MLLLFILLSQGFAEQQTDQRTHGTYSIIGRKSSIKNYPSLVGLRGNYKRCAGTLVAQNFVLTAGHCRETPPTAAYFGNTTITDGISYPLRIDDFFAHPGFNGHITSRTNDIALIKLPLPVELSETVTVAEMAEKDDVFKIGTVCKIAGWGSLDEGGEVETDLLHEAEMKITDPDECTGGIINSETELCLISIPGSNETTTWGDSGTSLWCKKEDGDDRYLLAGVDSRGGHQRTIFTKISKYRDWIDGTIDSHPRFTRENDYIVV